MTLSEHEQRTLDGIETGCREDDPAFAVHLDLTPCYDATDGSFASPRP